MNLFFNNEIFYLISRGLCVLTGVIICQFYEYCIFKSSYTNATSLVQKERLDALIVAAWQEISSLASSGRPAVVTELNQCLTPLVNSLTELQQLKESCQHSYSEQGETLILIEHYQEKLTSIYKWISLQGFNLLQSEPQQAISQVVELDQDSLEQKFSD
jgi:hypothetical protein